MLFYGLIFAGPLDYALLRRYCLCHPVAYATSGLFFVAIVALITKWMGTATQHKVSREATLALEDIALTQPDTPASDSGEQKALWFDTLWRTQSPTVCDSWLGQRVTAILQRQLKRRNTKHLDQDVHELADRDADQQHDSYGLIRIVTWAMPMLGFLGTVLGISDTLGQMDAQALASGSQDAMNGLTAGLYVAFDTTAIGLVLTMVAMFVQFGVNRSELSLLTLIDSKVAETMQLCLTEQEKLNDTSNVESALQHITQELLRSVKQIVQTQSELWQQTISVAHGHWQNLTSTSAQTIHASLVGAIETVLEKHQRSVSTQAELLARIHSEGAAQLEERVAAHSENLVRVQSRVASVLDARWEQCQTTLSEQATAAHHQQLAMAEQLARIQSDAANLIDARWQQWQTTLSDQARVVHQQQREMATQTELLSRLIEKHDAVKSMEMPLQATLEKLTDVDRFHDAAICLTEAVAVLGTQMERYGFLGRQPVRRRAAEPTVNEAVPEAVEAEEPAILPLKRRAG